MSGRPVSGAAARWTRRAVASIGARAEACAACAYHDRCCRSKSGAARTVTSDGREPLRRAMNERMSRPESRAIYSRRKVIVEPVFGQIKNTGFPGFGMRGQVEGGRRVLAGLRRAQRQENGSCGDRGSRAPGVRAKGGDGVESGLWGAL